MVQSSTLLAQTSGAVNANTDTSLLDPSTGLSAVLPFGAVVKKIVVYRDGDNTVTGSVGVKLGTDADSSFYINASDALSTSDLNSNQMAIKFVAGLNKGLDAQRTMKIRTDANLTTGSLVFEIDYYTY